MENFLRKIKLISSFSMTLSATKSEFTSALQNNVDEADIDGLFSGAFEAFTSSQNRFKGSVNHNGFKIRKRRRFFEKNFGKAIATGNLREHTKINGWNNFMFFFYGFITIIYGIFFGVFLLNLSSSGFEIFGVFFVFIHALFMYGIPYFMMRTSVRSLKEDLERELHFVLSKSNLLK